MRAWGSRWPLAAVIVVAAGLSACAVSGTATEAAGSSAAQPTPVAVSSAAPSPPAPVSASFQYQVQTTMTERDDAHVIRKYPKYTIQADQDALPPGIADATTALLNASVAQTVAGFEATGRRNGYQSVFAQGQQWEIDIAAQPVVRDDSILTVSYTASETFGGEDDEEPTAITVDMRTGKQLGLARLFTGGDSAQLTQAVSTALTDKAAASGPAGVSPPPVVPQEVTDILHNGRWYPDSDGFHVLAPSGVVGDIASGAANVDVPWSALAAVTTPFTRTNWES